MADVADLEAFALDEMPEVEIGLDLVKHGLMVAPALVLVSALISGVDGALSSAYAIAIVLANFLLSAFLLSRAARISPVMLMVAAMVGFVFRMGLVVVAIVLVRDLPWVDLFTMAVTMLVTHLGLLFWETRYVASSLAYPGLKPKGA